MIVRRWGWAALLLLTLLSPVARGADVAGHYHLQGFREVDSELLLKPDGKFQFMLSYGAADYWARGTWLVRDNAVILNSDSKRDAEAFRLLKSSSTKNEAICVRLQWANGSTAANIDVALNTEHGERKARTDSEGVARFERNGTWKSVVFRIPVYQLEAKPIAIDPAADDFTFVVDGEAVTELRFDNTRFAIKGPALTTFYWGPDREMKFEKSVPR